MQGAVNFGARFAMFKLISIIIPDVAILDVVVIISYNPKTFQKILSTKKHEGSPNPKKTKAQ